jgi:hypothetical protein
MGGDVEKLGHRPRRLGLIAQSLSSEGQFLGYLSQKLGAISQFFRIEAEPFVTNAHIPWVDGDRG